MSLYKTRMLTCWSKSHQNKTKLPWLKKYQLSIPVALKKRLSNPMVRTKIRNSQDNLLSHHLQLRLLARQVPKERRSRSIPVPVKINLLRRILLLPEILISKTSSQQKKTMLPQLKTCQQSLPVALKKIQSNLKVRT